VPQLVELTCTVLTRASSTPRLLTHASSYHSDQLLGVAQPSRIAWRTFIATSRHARPRRPRSLRLIPIPSDACDSRARASHNTTLTRHHHRKPAICDPRPPKTRPPRYRAQTLTSYHYKHPLPSLWPPPKSRVPPRPLVAATHLAHPPPSAVRPAMLLLSKPRRSLGLASLSCATASTSCASTRASRHP
jgi:hypothetical protein